MFAGTLDEPGSVLIAGKPAAVDSLNAFRGTAPVSPGTTTVPVTATDVSGNSVTQHYEVDTAGSTTTYTTDANGNQTGNGTHSCTWDARDQLVRVQVTARTDPLGRTTTYTYTKHQVTTHTACRGRRSLGLYATAPSLAWGVPGVTGWEGDTSIGSPCPRPT